MRERMFDLLKLIGKIKDIKILHFTNITKQEKGVTCVIYIKTWKKKHLNDAIKISYFVVSIFS